MATSRRVLRVTTKKTLSEFKPRSPEQCKYLIEIFSEARAPTMANASSLLLNNGTYHYACALR